MQKKNSVNTMTSYASVCHHGWSTQATWTNNFLYNNSVSCPEVLQRVLETILTWLRWMRREDTWPLEPPLDVYDTGAGASGMKTNKHRLTNSMCIFEGKKI